MTTQNETSFELIEPLRTFLESFTQELTEQQFIPAFRDELRRLVASLENLQQSEDTLQQIARGVDRLREVFAPAGTRLLEGVKSLETLMQTNASELQDRAGGVLSDLLKTHEELEVALRNEAGMLQEQSAVSRDALSRTASEIEQRLEALTGQIDGLCRRAEQEISSLATAAPRAVSDAAGYTTPVAASVSVAVPDDILQMLSRTERTVADELARYQGEVRQALKETTREGGEELARIDRTISEALAAIGPRIQDEIDGAVGKLRDQVQTLMAVEIESRPAQPRSEPGDKSSSRTSDKRLLHELEEVRKAHRSATAATERAIGDLAQGLREAGAKQADQIESESRGIQDSLARLERMLGEANEGGAGWRKQSQETRSALDGFSAVQKESGERIAGCIDSVEQKLEESRQTLSQMSGGMQRVEESATRAAEMALADGRQFRERIEASYRELREKLERGLSEENQKASAALTRLADGWATELNSLRGEIQEKFHAASDQLNGRFSGMEQQLRESRDVGQSIQRDLLGELRQASSALDTRFETLRTDTEALTQKLEGHVKAVSNEVAGFRQNQEKALAVLREAIRANYDDNAARLKEVIDSGYDGFLKQIATIPQSLERYANLMATVHQSDKLALDAIFNDTKNVLALSTEKFDTLVTDSGAIKKFFPLLDRKLEKHGGELAALRKTQVEHEKDVADLRRTADEILHRAEQSAKENRTELSKVESALAARFGETGNSLGEIHGDVKGFAENDLPTFRKELVSLLTSKFEFIETTLNERQEGFKKEIFERLSTDRKRDRRIYLLLGLLALLGVAVQLSIHTLRTGKLWP